MEQVETKYFEFANAEEPFSFEDGSQLGNLRLAYETYGTLAPDGGNAILLFHALTGSHHAAGFNPAVDGVGDLWRDECHAGWWEDFIGSGCALDTDKYFIICANYLGGCYGSSGPCSINPETDKPFASDFPMTNAGDIVNSQRLLLDHLGVKQLHAVLGGSLGGMLSLQFALRFPDRVHRVIPIACGMDVTVLQRIHNLEQVYAIETDPNFCAGQYYDGERPNAGLAHARMISHKTFLSLRMMEQRARSDIAFGKDFFDSYSISFPIESYMLHQGTKFVNRFDANTYIRIINAWQRYDLLKSESADSFETLFERCRQQRFLIFSIDSDVCYYPEDQAQLVRALKSAGVPVQHITVHSDKGHDAFLLEADLFSPYISYMLGEDVL